MEGVVGQHWVTEEGDTQVSGRQVDQEPVKWGPELRRRKHIRIVPQTQKHKTPSWVPPRLPLKRTNKTFKYPFDSEEDPNSQDVGCDAQQPSERGPDAHHNEEVHRGRRHSHQVQGAGDIHVKVMVTHIACKLEQLIF